MPGENPNPRHVGIILDGNGRWAQARGLKRSEGHRAGGEALDRLLDLVLDLRIPCISLYAFSTENWKRPKIEIQAIWSLMREFFSSRLERCLEKGIRVHASGDLSRLPAANRKLIQEVIEKTAKNRNLTANFCVNYGSQDEILIAATKVLHRRLELAKKEPRKAQAAISQSEFEKELFTYPLPPVDLMVRPGGEQRLSNFLLWQSAYAELYFTETLWPDFDKRQLMKALKWFKSRPRKFGGLLETED
ncbi:MAG: di-trans,poly-cis-decaprenylcistransferase [Leptospirales bacterium]|nr:di-trans,poly-cis-decaprenylcistransferase [Leptospirales bacterium]